MDLLQAKTLEGQFRGSIQDEHVAHGEFSADSLVLVPMSNRDVIRALQLARAAGSKVSVRSGSRVAKADQDLEPTSDEQSHVPARLGASVVRV